MTDIIEQVARAICIGSGYDPDEIRYDWKGGPYQQWRAQERGAKAAILATLKAIREPTPEQIRAGAQAWGMSRMEVMSQYRVMIDVLIKEMEDGE